MHAVASCQHYPDMLTRKLCWLCVQVVSDPSMNKSGVYWSWNSNTGAFENQVSEEVADDGKAAKLWEVSEKLVGLA